MKRKALLLGSTLILFSITAMLYLSSCKKEAASIQTMAVKQTTVKQTTASSSARFCGFKRCFIIPTPGRLRFNPFTHTFDCRPGFGFCSIWKVICVPDFFPCWQFKLPGDEGCIQCQLDPWRYTNIFVDPIPDLSIDLKIDPAEIEGQVGFIPVKVTDNIAILQFKQGIKGILDDQVLTLSGDFDLPKETVESLGLKGITIGAGKYPVVFDKESKTFNAIVAVK